jgi:hypothetical protein
MSVIIEGLALVVQRHALESRFPGGLRAFIHRAARADTLRFLCMDHDLVAISFTNRDAAGDAAVDLVRSGLCMPDPLADGDFVMVEELTGAVADCAWLQWSRQEASIARANARPGPPAADDVDADGRLRLCEEAGVVTWLDLRTGSFVTEPAKPAADLAALIRAALDEREIKYVAAGERGVLTNMRGDRGVYSICLQADSPEGYLLCVTRYGTYAPETRRTAVLDVLNRINYQRVAVGNFEMDFRDGEVGFRVALDTRIGPVSTVEVGAMVSRSMCVCDRYHDAILRVMLSGTDPEEALAMVQDT